MSGVSDKDLVKGNVVKNPRVGNSSDSNLTVSLTPTSGVIQVEPDDKKSFGLFFDYGCKMVAVGAVMLAFMPVPVAGQVMAVLGASVLISGVIVIATVTATYGIGLLILKCRREDVKEWEKVSPFTNSEVCLSLERMCRNKEENSEEQITEANEVQLITEANKEENSEEQITEDSLEYEEDQDQLITEANKEENSEEQITEVSLGYEEYEYLHKISSLNFSQEQIPKEDDRSE